MSIEQLRPAAVRLALIGAISVVALAAGVAKGANAPAPALPSGRQTVTVSPATGPAPGPARGMAVTGTGPGAQAHLGLPGTNAVTHGCSDGNRMETRLGMLKNSAVYAHCDFP
jgi:hypothetical protein